jgi:hypothetical protein
VILAEQGLALGGQVLPPVKFRFSPLPQQLVVSPRDEIRRLYSFSLEADTTIEQAEALEARIDDEFGVSALVVPLGGIGLYPAMLLETDSLEWTLDTIVHEWTHNWLTMFPVGWFYDASPELRTINETAASLVAGEIEPLVLARFYPELASPPPVSPAPTAPTAPAAARFDFQAEMHQTRLAVDGLLGAGRIAEAEAYMRRRRQLFWAHGYRIRKLNQAYFAFYGAYAQEPGASGEDPVGPAVVQLRAQSSSLAAFLRELAPLTSFEALQHALHD